MSLFNQGEKAYLLLADGTILEGIHFGVKGTAIGEVVFTTGMTAYQETMTDPSYYGQLVIQTFPLIGNYGVNEADNESDRSYIRGYIVREWCNTPSNFRMEGDVNSFLEEQTINGFHSIDTSTVTRKILCWNRFVLTPLRMRFALLQATRSVSTATRTRNIGWHCSTSATSGTSGMNWLPVEVRAPVCRL